MSHSSNDSHLPEIRCVQLLDAARRAGLNPVAFSHLHAMAYLAEALSPVWGVSGSAGNVLKREGLPFFPALQRAIDRLVWRGLVEVVAFNYVQDENQRWVLDASCRLDSSRAAGVVTRLRSFADERERSDLYLEVALGLAQTDDIALLFLNDASYSDPSVSVDRLIEFAPESAVNLSARMADRFSQVAGPGQAMSGGERVGLYLAHLDRLAAKSA